MSRSVCLSICQSVCQSVCLSICQFDCLLLCLLICLFICLFICLSIYLSVYLSVCVYICLSVYLPTYLPVCPSVCLSVCVPFYFYLSAITRLFSTILDNNNNESTVSSGSSRGGSATAFQSADKLTTAAAGAGTGGGTGGERRPNNISAKVQTSPTAAYLGPNSLLARGVYLNKMKPLSASRSRRGGRMSSNSSVDLETENRKIEEDNASTDSKKTSPLGKLKEDSPILKVKVDPSVVRIKVDSPSLRSKSEPQILRVKVEPPVLRGKEEPMVLQVKVEAQVFRERDRERLDPLSQGIIADQPVQRSKKFSRPLLLEGWEWDRRSLGMGAGTGTGTGTGGVVEGIALALSPATAYVQAIRLSTWDACTNPTKSSTNSTASAAVPAPVPVVVPTPVLASATTFISTPCNPLPLASIAPVPGTCSPSRTGTGTGKLLRPSSSRERHDSVVCDISDYYKQVQLLSSTESLNTLSLSLPLSRSSSCVNEILQEEAGNDRKVKAFHDLKNIETQTALH